MTVAATPPTKTYNEDGISKTFSVPFQFIAPTDLVVTRIDAAGVETVALMGADYNVAGGAAGPVLGTGSITMVAAKPFGWDLRIDRATPRTQPANYTPGDTFPAESHERALDREMLCIQEVEAEGNADFADLSARALRVPAGETIGELPAADDLKGKYLAFDAARNPIGSNGTGADLGLRQDLAELTGAQLVGDDGGTRWQTVAEALDFLGSSGPVLTPDQFGAVGDGVTNDSDAFTALAAAINAAGGGTVLIPPKTYIIGKQTFAGVTGLLYSYLMQKMLYFENCTRPVVVNLQGTLKIAPGLRYGGFNPVTGVAEGDNTFPFNKDLQAGLGFVIAGINCTGGLFVYGGGEIDGNQANVILGGVWGDTGRQIAAYGIYHLATPGAVIDIHVHHCCLDGLAYVYNGFTAATVARPIRYERVRSLYNARQGLTWAGGRALLAIGCEFSLTGRGTFSSAPGAGVDIEPDAADLALDGTFIDCVFADNNGVGMVTDVGVRVYNMLFVGCHFYGTTSYGVWANAPGVVFDSCTFSGATLGNFNAVRPADALRFVNCLFKPVTYQGRPPFVGGVGLFDFSVPVICRHCLFDNGNDPGIRLGSSVATAEFHSCTFQQSNCALGAIVRGTFHGNTVFKMDSGSNDFSGSANRGYLTGNGTWLSMGHVANNGGCFSAPFFELNRMGVNSVSYQINRTTGLTAFPVVAGSPSARGDFIWNTEPVAGGSYGWLCTVAGDPGTWVPVGIISAVRAASVALAAGASPTKAEFDALVNSLKTAKLMA